MHINKILSFSVVILLVTVVFAGAIPAAAQYDTMQYRYNAAHTGDYSPVAGPVPANGLLLWSFTTEGPVDSSPAVTNGTVYVGSVDGNVYAIGNAAAATSQSATPGFDVMFALVGLVIAAYVVRRRS